MTPDDSKFLAEVERIRQLPAQLDCADEDRLIGMVKERDAEIALLRSELVAVRRTCADLLEDKYRQIMDANRQRYEMQMERDRLRKMVDVARDHLELFSNEEFYDRKGELIGATGMGDTGGQFVTQPSAADNYGAKRAKEALAELDRLERGG